MEPRVSADPSYTLYCQNSIRFYKCVEKVNTSLKCTFKKSNYSSKILDSVNNYYIIETSFQVIDEKFINLYCHLLKVQKIILDIIHFDIYYCSNHLDCIKAYLYLFNLHLNIPNHRMQISYKYESMSNRKCDFKHRH